MGLFSGRRVVLVKLAFDDAYPYEKYASLMNCKIKYDMNVDSDECNMYVVIMWHAFLLIQSISYKKR
jgi:hypothetical protein